MITIGELRQRSMDEKVESDKFKFIMETNRFAERIRYSTLVDNYKEGMLKYLESVVLERAASGGNFVIHNLGKMFVDQGRVLSIRICAWLHEYGYNAFASETYRPSDSGGDLCISEMREYSISFGI